MIDNEWVFEQVYASFQPQIHRYLTRLIGAKEAEDLTQEVFIKVDKALKTFRNESQLSTWIYRIATNVAIDRAKNASFKQSSAEEYVASDIDVIVGRDICSAKQSLLIEDQVVRKEMNECIRELITSLPDNYRTVVILSDLEGFKDSQIAAILGLSVSTVKIRLHRAKEKLRKELLAHCLFYRTDCNQLACEPMDVTVVKKVQGNKSGNGLKSLSTTEGRSG